MDAIECIKNRRSVRNYLDRPINDNILKEIIDCGRLAATAINIQPWEFIVVKDKDTLKQLASLADHGKFIADSAATIVVVCKDTNYYLEDGSAATQNILLAARAHDIGSCWVAGDKKHYAQDVLSLLNVPDDYRLISLISLGYTGSFPDKPKRPLEEVYHNEKF